MTYCWPRRVLFAAMVGEHERSAGAWQSEWETLAELLRTVAGAAGGRGGSSRD